MFVNPPPQKIARAAAPRAGHRRRRAVGRPHSPEPRRGACLAALRLPHHPGDPLGRDRSSARPPCPRSISCREVLAPGERVDIVDVFRRPEHVAGIVADCIRLKLPALWLQEGVIDQAAAERAVRAGIFTVMDRCLFKDRAALR